MTYKKPSMSFMVEEIDGSKSEHTIVVIVLMTINVMENKVVFTGVVHGW